MSEQMYRCEKWACCPRNCYHKNLHGELTTCELAFEGYECKCIPIPASPTVSHAEIMADVAKLNAEADAQMAAGVDQPERKMWEVSTEPFIPDFRYDDEDERPSLIRGAVNYSKMINYKAIELAAARALFEALKVDLMESDNMIGVLSKFERMLKEGR